MPDQDGGIFRVAAFGITRADDDVQARALGPHAGEVAWVVRAVGIHAQQVAPLRFGNAGADRVAILVAAATVHVTHAVGRADLRGVVHRLLGVDDQHLELRGQRSGRGLTFGSSVRSETASR